MQRVSEFTSNSGPYLYREGGDFQSIGSAMGGPPSKCEDTIRSKVEPHIPACSMLNRKITPPAGAPPLF